MNRLLSGLRSRALKSIELSRGLGTAEGYGNCNVRSGLAPFKLLVISGLKAWYMGGGASIWTVLLPLEGMQK